MQMMLGADEFFPRHHLVLLLFSEVIGQLAVTAILWHESEGQFADANEEESENGGPLYGLFGSWWMMLMAGISAILTSIQVTTQY
jgi:hypothetical protein